MLFAFPKNRVFRADGFIIRAKNVVENKLHPTTSVSTGTISLRRPFWILDFMRMQTIRMKSRILYKNQTYTAAAPATISDSSFVMPAWRVLL